MKLPACSVLCDAIELTAILLKKRLSHKDLVNELTVSAFTKDPEGLVIEALGVASRRQEACSGGYPFSISARSIEYKPSGIFNPYTFLVVGNSLCHGGAAGATKIVIRFRRHFEDLVCWGLRRSGYTAEVLSEPRRPRGLPTSLKPALRIINERMGERAKLQKLKIAADDNDLGVDVIATHPKLDPSRSGRLIVLLQCATSLSNIFGKLNEKDRVFSGVWQFGFYQSCCVRGIAVPDDLIKIDEVQWDRLCAQAWTLDRCRIVHLAQPGTLAVPQSLTDLNVDLLTSAPKWDWRNGWRQSLDS